MENIEIDEDYIRTVFVFETRDRYYNTVWFNADCKYHARKLLLQLKRKISFSAERAKRARNLLNILNQEEDIVNNLNKDGFKDLETRFNNKIEKQEFDFDFYDLREELKKYWRNPPYGVNFSKRRLVLCDIINSDDTFKYNGDFFKEGDIDYLLKKYLHETTINKLLF